jgi:hypothetical protein
MADNSKSDTAEVSIAADNETLQQLLDNQYGRLESGEARAALEETYTTVWNEDEFQATFNLIETAPPYVTVANKESGQTGTLIYVDSPRFYFLFNPESSSNAEQ